MARLHRLTAPDLPHLVLQRSLNQEPIFLSLESKAFFLESLFELSKQHACSVHAYALNSYEAKLLITPASEQALPALMKVLARQLTQQYNKLNNRSGTIWEGRYRAAAIDPSIDFSLQAMLFLDLQAGEHVNNIFNSSHNTYTGAQPTVYLAPLASYWSLGNTPFARESAYKEMYTKGLADSCVRALTDALTYGWPYGGESFLAKLNELNPGRRLTRGTSGRPVKLQSVPN